MTANTETVWGAEDLSSLPDWEAGRCRSQAMMNRSEKLLKEEVSVSPLDVLRSSVQHPLYTAVAAAFTDGLGGGQWMKSGGGEAKEVRQGETTACSGLYLPE